MQHKKSSVKDLADCKCFRFLFCLVLDSLMNNVQMRRYSECYMYIFEK